MSEGQHTNSIPGKKVRPGPQFESLATSSPGGDRSRADFVPLQKRAERDGDFVPFVGETSRPDEIKEDLHTLEKTQQRMSLLERDAYEKGFGQGERDGLELGKKKAREITKRMENLLDSLTHLKEEILRYHEREILELLFEIAKKISYIQLESDTRSLKETILNALHLAAEKSEVVIRINPGDKDFVEQLRPEFFSRFEGIESLRVAPDPAVRRGGCVLETPYGAVDARIDTRLKRIHESLEDAFTGRQDVSTQN